MRNIYLLGDGVNSIYAKENIEYKLKYGILKIEEYLQSYFKHVPKANIIKPDSSKCKAHLFFDDNYQIYTNINEQRIFYKQDLSLTKYDFIIVYDNVLQIHDKIDLTETKDVFKIIKVSANTLGEIIKHGKINNAILFIEKKDLEENGIYFNAVDPIEIYKILRRIPNMETSVFIIDNYYFLLENNEFHILYHNEQKPILGYLEILISGFTMEYDFSYLEALKFAIKLTYFYNELGLNNKEEVIKSAIKKDIDIHQININKAHEINGIFKDDYKSAKNIVRYGKEAINIPFYEYKNVILIDYSIINEHKELLKIIDKKNLSILINGENSFSYIKEYFDEKIYENMQSMEEIIVLTRNENIQNRRAIFYFEGIEESLKNDLLNVLKKGLYKRENHELYVDKMTCIFNIKDDVEKYDISLQKPSLNTKVERAIFLRKILENYPKLFTDNECHISDEVINVFINGNLFFEENSIIKVLNLTNLNTDVLTLNNLPAKNILDKYIDTRIDNEMVEKIALKLTSINDFYIDKEKYISYASQILEAMDEKNISYRLSLNPLDFSLTEQEIDFLASSKVKKDNLNWSFIDEKEKAKERNLIKKIPKIFKDLGYELYLKQ